MERILITGVQSYLGTSFEKWVSKWSGKYSVDTIDMKKDNWKEADFSKYNVVLHVAGIVHIKETKENEEIYYRVNRDLVYETALKAKVEGVKQFIFLSSMSVYGLKTGVVDSDTPLKPTSNYGKSKLEGEELIKSLNDNNFKVVILRPPMIYGRGCKGNYQRLAKLAVNTMIFPDIDNRRSMIYINNLCEFVRLLIEDSKSGIFFPQNEEYVCTSKMVEVIAKAHGKKVWLTKAFNPIIRVFKFSTVSKLFGDLVYDKKMSTYGKNYWVCDFETTLREIEELEDI